MQQTDNLVQKVDGFGAERDSADALSSPLPRSWRTQSFEHREHKEVHNEQEKPKCGITGSL